MEAKLFRGRSSLVLEQANHVALGNAKTALQESLANTYVDKLFANNFGWSGFGLALTLLLVAAILVVLGATHRYQLLAALVVGMVLPLPFIMGGAAMMFSGWQRTLGGGARLFGGLLLLVLAVFGGLFVVAYNDGRSADFLLTLAVFLAGAVSGLGFYWLKAPSRSGRNTMDNIEGFRQYLGTAEEDRLNALNPPDKTPELFERFLPYAVALDVQNEWAKRFAGVLAAAGAGAVAYSWYTGDRTWGNDPVAFADHLGSDLSQTISSASTAPGSSSSGGSGGGGSSGGGGGGGGGSGW
jgi:uncharacterized membrane protein YgcG